jgi:hypothetical protein
MANRAMAAKVLRAKREGRAAYWMESSKAPYLAPTPNLPAYDESKVQRFDAPAPRKRQTMKPDTRPRPAITGAWAIGEYGLISR